MHEYILFYHGFVAIPSGRKINLLTIYSPDFTHKTIFIFKTLFQYIYTVAAAHKTTVIHDRHYPRRRITPVSKWQFFQNNHLCALRVRGIKLTKTLQYSINVVGVSLRIVRDN